MVHASCASIHRSGVAVVFGRSGHADTPELSALRERLFSALWRGNAVIVFALATSGLACGALTLVGAGAWGLVAGMLAYSDRLHVGSARLVSCLGITPTLVLLAKLSQTLAWSPVVVAGFCATAVLGALLLGTKAAALLVGVDVLVAGFGNWALGYLYPAGGTRLQVYSSRVCWSYTGFTLVAFALVLRWALHQIGEAADALGKRRVSTSQGRLETRSTFCADGPRAREDVVLSDEEIARSLDVLGRGFALAFGDVLTAVRTALERAPMSMDAATFAPLATIVADAATLGASRTRGLLLLSRQWPNLSVSIPFDDAVRSCVGAELARRTREIVLTQSLQSGRTIAVPLSRFEQMFSQMIVAIGNVVPSGAILHVASSHQSLHRALTTKGATIQPGQYAVISLHGQRSSPGNIAGSSALLDTLGMQLIEGLCQRVGGGVVVLLDGARAEICAYLPTADPEPGRIQQLAEPPTLSAGGAVLQRVPMANGRENANWRNRSFGAAIALALGYAVSGWLWASQCRAAGAGTWVVSSCAFALLVAAYALLVMHPVDAKFRQLPQTTANEENGASDGEKGGGRETELSSETAEIRAAMIRLTTRLTSVVAHDLNNCLHAMIGSAELLAMTLKNCRRSMSEADELEARELITEVARSTDYAEALLEHLQCNLPESLPAVSLDVSRAIVVMMPKLQAFSRGRGRSGLALTQHTVPDCLVRIEVRTLEQILLNLVLHVRDATAASGPCLLTTDICSAEAVLKLVASRSDSEQRDQLPPTSGIEATERAAVLSMRRAEQLVLATGGSVTVFRTTREVRIEVRWPLSGTVRTSEVVRCESDVDSARERSA